MKILIDCRFWGTKSTGLGRYTQNLVENLLKIDKKNKYTLLFKKEEYKNFKYPRLNAQHLLVNLPYYSLKEQLLLPKIIKKINPDLVHFPHFNAPIFSNYPFVVTIHDLIKHHFKGTETTTRQALIYYFKYWGYQQVFQKTITKAEKIIVPSLFVKKQILRFYNLSPSKIKVIYEGVSKKFQNIKSIKNNKKLKVKTKNYFFYIGNAYPHKNLNRLILAIKKLNLHSQKKHSLVIVSPRDVFYQRLAKNIKRFQTEKLVKLIGHVADERLQKLYIQALAFISPSLMEGFGLPGLEALSVGCPLLCSNIPTFKEIYGQAALYFDPQNIDDMVEKIKKIIKFSSQQRQQLVSKGKQQANKYSWQKCAQQTLQVYNLK